MPTVHAIAISEQEEEEQEASAEADEDKLLEALSGPKPLPIADLARICDWLLANGKPHKSKTFRVLDRLVKEKLVKKVRGRRYRLTEEGRKIINTDDEDDEIETTIEDRGGVVSKKPFHALKGMKQGPTVPCAYCSRTGDVFGFADGRQPKGQRHYAHLHEGCAKDLFTGKPKPANGGSGSPESLFH